MACWTTTFYTASGRAWRRARVTRRSRSWSPPWPASSGGRRAMARIAAEKELTLDVSGMTCGSCVQRIEKTLLKQPGVLECRVNLATAEARVRLADDAVPFDALRAAVRARGYDI